jgi:AraC-like DNA-binding protein
MRFALRKYNSQPAIHTHDFAQVIFPIDGEMHLETENLSIDVGSHAMALVPPQHRHCFHTSQNSRFLVLDINPSLLLIDNIPAILTARSMRLLELAPHVWRLFHFLSEEIAVGLTLGEEYETIALAGLGLAERSDLSRVVPSRSGRLSAVAEDLRHPECMTLPVAAWARRAGLSPSRFHELFKEMTGLSPSQYRSRHLLNRAALRLQTSTDPIGVIALAFGYENPSAFIRAFRRQFGTTPARFRESPQAAPPYTG